MIWGMQGEYFARTQRRAIASEWMAYRLWYLLYFLPANFRLEICEYFLIHVHFILFIFH
jgi:hypothetical protein